MQRLTTPETLWYEDQDGKALERGPEYTCEAPGEAYYQVHQFPTTLKTTHRRLTRSDEVEACLHPEEKIRPTYGWVDGVEGRECRACNGHQTRDVGSPWPTRWDASGSKDILTASRGWDTELVLLMANDGYELGDAILIAAHLCERCWNLMLNHYGSSNGYPSSHEDCQTSCDLCDEVKSICKSNGRNRGGIILIRFGRWSHLAGRWLVWDRIYRKGYKWTPFCRVRRRYPRRPEAQTRSQSPNR